MWMTLIQKINEIQQNINSELNIDTAIPGIDNLKINAPSIFFKHRFPVALFAGGGLIGLGAGVAASIVTLATGIGIVIMGVIFIFMSIIIYTTTKPEKEIKKQIAEKVKNTMLELKKDKGNYVKNYTITELHKIYFVNQEKEITHRIKQLEIIFQLLSSNLEGDLKANIEWKKITNSICEILNQTVSLEENLVNPEKKDI